MSGTTIRLETDERGVATLTLARPQVKNAFDAQLIAELTSSLGRIVPDTRCVVLRGDGDMFCSGADLSWMRSMVDTSHDENASDSHALAEMFAKLDELAMPIVARVQGAALGGGAGLVAIADIAIAADDAMFGFPEVRLGILPAIVSPYVVRKIGVANATAAFVSGVRFDARRARDFGLVQGVEPLDSLDHTVDHFIEGILASGPAAVRTAKRLVREVAGRPPQEVRALTVERIAEVRTSEEGQEGMRAFLEKRRPRWQG